MLQWGRAAEAEAAEAAEATVAAFEREVTIFALEAIVAHRMCRRSAAQACLELMKVEAGEGSKHRASSSGVLEGGLEPPRPLTGTAQPFVCVFVQRFSRKNV